MHIASSSSSSSSRPRLFDHIREIFNAHPRVLLLHLRVASVFFIIIASAVFVETTGSPSRSARRGSRDRSAEEGIATDCRDEETMKKTGRTRLEENTAMAGGMEQETMKKTGRTRLEENLEYFCEKPLITTFVVVNPLI
ncbi:hypothetical protein Syun_020141 [Stephania yunnanensis]|uniref:Uncharacterized protein n=1 Tax=Stephania yunnanensis TaxID=152371 RepID=A0AAP0IDB6_9MAGN